MNAFFNEANTVLENITNTTRIMPNQKLYSPLWDER
jgi:hypothetical protein